MDEFYTIVRTVYFFWGFFLFVAMTYVGIQDILLARRCGHASMSQEHEWFAFTALACALTLTLSLGEIFLESVPGGWRVPLPAIWLTPATVGLVRGFFRVRAHRHIVEQGNCPDRTIG